MSAPLAAPVSVLLSKAAMAEVVELDEDERTTDEDDGDDEPGDGESCNIDSLSRSWPEEDEIKLRVLLPDGKTLRMRRINSISEESDEPLGLAAEVIESG